MSSHGEITHVSDTALMVAAARALESESPDGFVKDPFAARLAGERGMAILRALPQAGIMQFGMAVRSRFIDQLLLEALAAKPIATVLNLGCGLDTRPWRLDLPPGLRWIEADFAEMLDYKDAALAGETPRCGRERLVVDANDPAQRRAMYAAAGSSPTLLITEGLLMYLPGATVEALAAEVPQTSIGDWIVDITTAAFQQAINSDTDASIRNVQAAEALEGQEIFDTLRRHGWTSVARRSYITDMGFAMERIRRTYGAPRPPQAGSPPMTPPSDEPSGIHRMCNSTQSAA